MADLCRFGVNRAGQYSFATMSDAELTLYHKVQTLANLNKTTGLLLLVINFLHRHFWNMVEEAKVHRSLIRKNYFPLEREFLLMMGLLCNLKCKKENAIIVNACMILIGYDGYDRVKKPRFRQFVERVRRVLKEKSITNTMVVHFSAHRLRNKRRSAKHESAGQHCWCY